MDRRIIKTKRCLKAALVTILKEPKPFEKITVTELCEEAATSRITFYTHYSDKYDLLEDLFNDLNDEMLDCFNSLETKTNEEQDPVKTYENLLDAFLATFYNKFGFITVDLQENLDIILLYYRYLKRNMDKLGEHFTSKLVPKYDKTQINAFIALGLFGFIHAADHDKMSREEICRQARSLLVDLANSDIYLH